MAIIRANNNTLSSVTALPTAIATGSMVKLFSLTGNTSGASEYDIDNTYINSTYDNYYVFFNTCSATASSRELRIRFIESGTVNESANYWYMAHQQNGNFSQDQDAGTYIQGSRGVNAQSGDGQGVAGYFYLFNVNNTNSPTFLIGQHWYTAGAASNLGVDFSGGYDDSKNTVAINGIRFYQSAVNILMREFAIYGITK